MLPRTNNFESNLTKDSIDNFAPDFSCLRIDENERLEEYGRFQQHIVLLEDRHRVSTFIKAIVSKPPGEVLVDVGAGTGVFAIAALKHGFKHAFLIEPSLKISTYAKHLADINGLSSRITIITSKLESISPDILPRQIDLIVTETLSSLLFGFGSWDALPQLAKRLSSPANVIPAKGKLFACLCSRDFATRGQNTDGLGLLNRLGIQVDLFDHAFRSGGNIYDKETVSLAIAANELVPATIASFDFSKECEPIDLNTSVVPVPFAQTYKGLVLYWTVDLTLGESAISMTSKDPALTSWYPCYVPFSRPIDLQPTDSFSVKLVLHPIDAPYKYAFQFMSDGHALSKVLYW